MRILSPVWSGVTLAAVAALLLTAPAAADPAMTRPAMTRPATAAAPSAPAALAPIRLALAPLAPAPLIPVSPALAPPQGPLPQTGCVITGTQASCDLWAKPGTVVLPGAAAPVPIWGFTSTAAGAASLPGPVLVVDQGDQVTITVHNALSSALSLALPAVTGLTPDTVGAPAGQSVSYTFTASRPGTYLYQAGHTTHGARQVAMGLVGALVVRAPALAGGAPTGYGDAASQYDDEALLVLTEVDPALNTSADPLSFDLRAYAPKYRLINGKAFPETDPIGTDVGRRVLLRYVAAGLQPHPMTLLGVDQSVVGQSGRPVAYPEGAVTLALQPGQTADAIVTMPTSPDGDRFALMESGNQLNNAGQHYGAAQPGVNPPQAFGGMLTFLDTNPAPPSGDHIGPTAATIAAQPNPASVLNPITVTASFTDALNGNSIVDAAEVVVDDLSVAEGTGIAFTSPAFGTAPVITGASATVATSVLTTLTQGQHTLWVRAHDVAGNWGVVGSATLTLSVTGAATTALVLTPAVTTGVSDVAVTATGDDNGLGGTVTGAEYFVDLAGGNGTGTAMTLSLPNAAITAENGTIPAVRVAALAEGSHTVLVHTSDSFGLWGPYAIATLVVDRSGPTLLVGAALPAVTNGTVGSPSDPADVRINAAFSDPVSAGVSSAIAAAEGFLDVAGADGAGFTFLALDGSFNSATENTYGLLPLSELTGRPEGGHQVLVHARDAAGNWGPLTSVTFTLDRTGPAVSAMAASPNPTGGAATLALTATAADGTVGISAAEWYDGTDPGVGHGSPMTLAGIGPTSAALSTSINLGGFTAGDHTLSVRARDVAGNWGAPSSVTIAVVQSNAIFSDAFGTSNTSAWSQTVGTVSAASGALLATGTGYVVDNTPISEVGLYAKFDLFVGSFPANGAVVDVLSARGASGTFVARVQYRKTTAGVSQFRLGLQRSTGVANTAWVNAAGGTVRVDWSSATAGSATLRVGAVTVGTLTGNTSAYRVDSVALGLVAGAPAAATATFDNYASTRFTQP